MTTYQGHEGAITVDGNEIAQIRNWSFSETTERVDVTDAADSHMQRKAGVKSASGEVECLYDPDDTNGQAVLANGATVTLVLYPIGNSEGNKRITLDVIISDFRYNNPNKRDVIPATFQWESAGDVTHDTVPGS